jgi:preprotein translocase subunit SecA
MMLDLIEDAVVELVDTHCPKEAHVEDWDLHALNEVAFEMFNLRPFQPVVQIDFEDAVLASLRDELQAAGHPADARHLKAALAQRRAAIEKRANAEEMDGGDLAARQGLDTEIEALDEAARGIVESVDVGEVDLSSETLREHVYEVAAARYEAKEGEIGSYLMRQAERYFYLQTIDKLWREHLLSMDHLRDGIGLRGYAQRDPKQEYKKEGYELFVDLMRRIRVDTLGRLFRVYVEREEQVQRKEEKAPRLQLNRTADGEVVDGRRVDTGDKRPVVREHPKLGRNDPCFCGSGRKYKHCHGARGAQASA